MKIMIGAIILAAGNSSRFGSNKLLYPLNGKLMYHYVLENLYRLLQEKQLDYLILVTQYDRIEQEIQSNYPEVMVVRNDVPNPGISHSIFLGLETLKQNLPEAEACLFAVSDQPYLTYDSVAGLLRTWKNTEKGIAACAHEDVIGNPVVFSKKYFDELKNLSGDKGGKRILMNHMEDAILYPVPARELEDIDVKSVLKKTR